VTYETFYRADSAGRLFKASSRIAFPDRETVAALIGEAGLHVDRWLGDWRGGPWSEDSPEIIPVGRLAS
jgi:hypothetical protein